MGQVSRPKTHSPALCRLTNRLGLLVSWAERGGPLVTPPSRKGFGHTMFERLVTKSLNGSVGIDFAPEGLTWKLSIPITNLVTEPVVIRHRSAFSGSRS
jgi:two-component sensor histidine kinase